MTSWRLVARSLVHFRGANLAVAAAIAVAAAVLTGAMVIGDSVDLSLRDLAIARLGPVEAALTSERFFDASLADRLGTINLDNPLGQPAPNVRASSSLGAGILLNGSAANAAESRRTAGVQVGALPENLLAVPPGTCIMNQALAEALGAAAGQDILLTFPRAAAAPAASTLAQRGREEHLAHLRVTVGAIAPSPSLAGDFSLYPTQRPAPRVWANLDELSRAAGRAGGANIILYGAPARHAPPPGPTTRPALTIEDAGLIFTSADDVVVLGSQSIYLPPAMEQAVPAGAKRNRVLVELISEARVADGTAATRPVKAIHYAVVAGLDEPPGGPLKEEELALNAWAAEQLGARVGDRIELNYFQRAGDGHLAEVKSRQPLRVARVVPTEPLGADATLTPYVAGLTDADTISQWHAPQEWGIDPNKITPADEEYWRKYKAAPKLFLNLAAAQKLWGQSFGRLTSIRFEKPAPPDLAQQILARLDLPAMGLHLRPLRQEQLPAAGNTEFAGLFAGLSFFLIAAALLLTALLMALAVEQRSRQHGLLAAVGMSPGAIRRLALVEGSLLAIAGTLVGVAASALYTAAILAGLRTWWLPAVGTTALSLHLEPLTLASGAAFSLATALVAILWATWRIGRWPLAALLAGRRSLDPAVAPRPRSRRRSIVLAAALSLLAIAVLFGAIGAAAAWVPLVAGGLILAALLAWVNVLLRPRRPEQPRFAGSFAIVRLSLGNAQRGRTRSLLVVGLLALATFILVTAGALGLGQSANIRDRASGSGGFALVARADIPLPASPATAQGCRLMRIPASAAAILDSVRFVALSGRMGDDLSCLNLNRPTQPALLSVPAGALTGRFTFARTIEHAQDLWALLEKPAEAPGPTIWPFIADDDTARYMLHVEPGETLSLQDAAGRPRRLKLVATLAASVFQGELLVSQRGLEDLFPGQSGFVRLLVEVPPADEAAVREVLTSSLGEYGLIVEPAGQVLGRYSQVAQAYLSTFQLLGGLGLLLGTVGLAVVLLRNLIQRRSELMLLAAIGFTPARRAILILIQNAGLLLAGLAAGLMASLAALAAGGRAGSLNAAPLAATLLTILLVGLAVLTSAVYLGGQDIRPAQMGRE